MIKQDKIRIISPKHDTLDVSGEISYGESQKAWNLIRLKHDILKEFKVLKDRRKKFVYNMIMHRSYEDLEKAIKDMKKQGLAPPILLFLGEKKN